MNNQLMPNRWFDGEFDALEGSDKRPEKPRRGESGTAVVEAHYYGVSVTWSPSTTFEIIYFYQQDIRDHLLSSDVWNDEEPAAVPPNEVESDCEWEWEFG